MQAVAFGEVGLAPSEFWNMTTREILNAHRGHMEKELNKWRMTRWLAASVYNAPRGKNDPVVKPSDLMKLPGDEDYTDHEADIKMLKERRNGK